MCGISGIFHRSAEAVSENVMRQMNDTLIHRGPDYGGIKLFGNAALAHRRLSIIDLSCQANQPMSSSDERYTIVFNGEVYNFKEIREQLHKNGVEFHTTSDTEVVLNAFVSLGFKAFSLFNGMFAIAIYDNIANKIILARDQFGIKPLYYFINDRILVFASEKKAILVHPFVHPSINRQAVSEYIWFGNPLGENTIYNEIREIRPGSYIVITEDTVEETLYFNINKINEQQISESEAIARVKDLFSESVKRHLISDVPVGVFLSGGIDSSAITAIGSQHYSGKLKTFSVGFDYDKGVNELSLAREVAQKFGTDHYEINISGNNVIEVIEKMVNAHDEPFGDAADIPLYLLTNQLKGAIKVVLQGDGGDEFFGGYKRYRAISKMSKWKMLSFLPSLIGLSGTQNFKALRVQRFLNAIAQKRDAITNGLLLTMESNFTNPNRVFKKDFFYEGIQNDPFKRFEEVYKHYPEEMDKAQRFFFTDTQIILKDTYFEKVDKASMANSIEVRVPFLDKDLAEFMLSVPASLKIKNNVQKYLLKKALNGLVPDKILYGKKQGFGVPYEFWLRSSLSDYFVEQVTTEENSKYLNQEEILKMFKIHKSNKGNFGFLLWKTLIFSVWNNRRKV